MTTNIDAAIATIPAAIATIIYSCAKGSYQRDLLAGRENWSGSSLAGKAAKYAGHYARSRENLVERIRDEIWGGWTAEYALRLRPTASGRRRWQRYLVLTSPGGEEIIWS